MARRYRYFWRDVGGPVGVGLMFSLYIAFMAGMVLWGGWQDYQDTNHGRHGMMTLRSCDEKSSEHGRHWDCTGKFRSDDGTIVIDPITTTLNSPPGEVAYGWVRDASDEDLNPIGDPVSRETFEKWRFWAVLAIGAPLALGLLVGLGRATYERRW
jgi:hypothetical protein